MLGFDVFTMDQRIKAFNANNSWGGSQRASPKLRSSETSMIIFSVDWQLLFLRSIIWALYSIRFQLIWVKLFSFWCFLCDRFAFGQRFQSEKKTFVHVAISDLRLIVCWTIIAYFSLSSSYKSYFFFVCWTPSIVVFFSFGWPVELGRWCSMPAERQHMNLVSLIRDRCICFVSFFRLCIDVRMSPGTRFA